MIGLIVIAAVVELLLHKYVPPPLAVSVALDPLHIETVAGEMFAVGFALTVTVLLAVAVHPFAFVTVTV